MDAAKGIDALSSEQLEDIIECTSLGTATPARLATAECVAFSAVKNDPLLRAQNRRRLEDKLDVGVLKSSSCHGTTEINTVRSGLTPNIRNLRNLQLSDAALLDECSGKCPDSKLCDCE